MTTTKNTNDLNLFWIIGIYNNKRKRLVLYNSSHHTLTKLLTYFNKINDYELC